ncbi:hypothetical protein XH93_11055 [Bradyrhizobium sp. CCBAU 51753]|nr:hypothetical protein XH93_11055 [Bradyrhizobium sp. CCBAU 51753]
MSKIERLPVKEFCKGFSRTTAQPADQIGQNRLRIWRPVMSLDIADLKAETTKFSQNMRNIFANRLDHGTAVPVDRTEQF